jgi:hypothetical protein
MGLQSSQLYRSTHFTSANLRDALCLSPSHTLGQAGGHPRRRPLTTPSLCRDRTSPSRPGRVNVPRTLYSPSPGVAPGYRSARAVFSLARRRPGSCGCGRRFHALGPALRCAFRGGGPGGVEGLAPPFPRVCARGERWDRAVLKWSWPSGQQRPQELQLGAVRPPLFPSNQPGNDDWYSLYGT